MFKHTLGLTFARDDRMAASNVEPSLGTTEQRLDEGAGEPADEVPGALASKEEVVAEDEHAEDDEGEKDGKEGPGFDVARVIRRRLGAHDGKSRRS